MNRTASKPFRAICVAAGEPSARCEMFATEEDACSFAVRALEGSEIAQVIVERQNADGFWECLEIHKAAR